MYSEPRRKEVEVLGKYLIVAGPLRTLHGTAKAYTKGVANVTKLS